MDCKQPSKEKQTVKVDLTRQTGTNLSNVQTLLQK